MISPVMSCFVAVKKTIGSVRASEEKINKKGGGEEEKEKPFFPSHMEQMLYVTVVFFFFSPLMSAFACEYVYVSYQKK